MWVKFEKAPSVRAGIYVPAPLSYRVGTRAEVRFGNGLPVLTAVFPEQKDAGSSAEKADGQSSAGDSYENPMALRVTTALAEKLRLPEGLTFRMRLQEGKILIGPVIGLLLGVHTHRYSPKHMRKYSDRMGIYPQVGGLICAFSPQSVDWEQQAVYGLYYNVDTEEWEYGCFPMPQAIYRRDFHSDPESIRRLAALTGERLFNSYRFSKTELFDVLQTDETLRAHLPQTETSAGFAQMKGFLARWPKVILKPVDLSRGRGICVIERVEEAYRVTDYRYEEPSVTVLKDLSALESFFTLNPGLFRNYLVQRYLSLARVGDALFDIRVVMQKYPDGQWKETGVECRVAGGHSHLTNISRGGYALTLDEALSRAFGRAAAGLPDQIEDFCVRFCRHMDTLGEHFAEFGIDIAVDDERGIWLIEANVFPSFKGFKRTDRRTYLAIRHTPLLYALSLTPFGREERGNKEKSGKEADSEDE